jgi:hypothetical protein
MWCGDTYHWRIIDFGWFLLTFRRIKCQG